MIKDLDCGWTLLCRSYSWWHLSSSRMVRFADLWQLWTQSAWYTFDYEWSILKHECMYDSPQWRSCSVSRSYRFLRVLIWQSMHTCICYLAPTHLLPMLLRLGLCRCRSGTKNSTWITHQMVKCYNTLCVCSGNTVCEKKQCDRPHAKGVFLKCIDSIGLALVLNL